MATAYEINEDGRPTGPYSLLVLRQKADIYALKPDALVRLANGTPGADAPPWTPIHEIPELHRYLFPKRTLPRLATTAPFDAPNASADAAVGATEIVTLLRDNTARQVAAENESLAPFPKRPNRRLWDYLIVSVSLNAFVAVAGHFVGYHNPFVVALFSMGNVGLVWVLFFVMDRY